MQIFIWSMDMLDELEVKVLLVTFFQSLLNLNVVVWHCARAHTFCQLIQECIYIERDVFIFFILLVTTSSIHFPCFNIKKMFNIMDSSTTFHHLLVLGLKCCQAMISKIYQSLSKMCTFHEGNKHKLQNASINEMGF